MEAKEQEEAEEAKRLAEEKIKREKELVIEAARLAEEKK